jgi:hypothetical protein
MAKDFNVYQWRRNHLNENVEEKYSTQQYREDNEINNFTKGEKIDRMSTSFQDEKGNDIQIGVNEEKVAKGVIRKSIDDLTWSDVEGLSLPTKVEGVNRVMEKGFERFLDEWKALFNDEDKKRIKVTIEKKINFDGLNQSDPIGSQARADREAGINPGLD